MPQTKTTHTFVGIWLPSDLAKRLNEAVKESDSDKSKYIRNALRERIANDLGRETPDPRRAPAASATA